MDTRGSTLGDPNDGQPERDPPVAGSNVWYYPAEGHDVSALPGPYVATVGYVHEDGSADLYVLAPGKPAFWAEGMRQGDGPDSFGPVGERREAPGEEDAGLADREAEADAEREREAQGSRDRAAELARESAGQAGQPLTETRPASRPSSRIAPR